MADEPSERCTDGIPDTRQAHVPRFPWSGKRAKVPDQNTIWQFREELTRKGLFDKLFDTFYRFLEEKGLIMKEGVIIDGSFVDVSRQRNTREENRQIKEDKQTFKIIS